MIDWGAHHNDIVLWDSNDYPLGLSLSETG